VEVEVLEIVVGQQVDQVVEDPLEVDVMEEHLHLQIQVVVAVVELLIQIVFQLQV
tara:strand:- start:20 stop:184 length:165 start_codon:yes stop_codon:yes gene_type:complete